MKVAMITPRYPPNIKGGGEISCKLLVDTLRNKDLNIDVLSGDVLFPNVKSKEILNLKMYQYLKKRIYDYDVFHTYNMSLLPCLGLLTKKYNINSVASLNGIVYSPTLGSNVAKHKRLTHCINKTILNGSIRHIKRFTTLSSYFKQIWVKDGIQNNRITVIPNMISKDYVSKKKKTYSDLTRLLFVGNYAKWRNLKLLLDTYSLLDENYLLLTVVGSGWDDLVKEYNNSWNTIVYYPHMDHNILKHFFRKADIYIQPYEVFGVGRTLLESAQNETAIVTTGKFYDYPYLNKYLMYFNDGYSLCNCLTELINNKRYRKFLATNCRDIVNKYFSPEFISEKYIELYRKG